MQSYIARMAYEDLERKTNKSFAETYIKEEPQHTDEVVHKLF
ncbi:hypothetical protein [Pedobacter cryophilus]|nr:hypothetical protein [Pedobacter cryophilus]